MAADMIAGAVLEAFGDNGTAAAAGGGAVVVGAAAVAGKAAISREERYQEEGHADAEFKEMFGDFGYGDAPITDEKDQKETAKVTRQKSVMGTSSFVLLLVKSIITGRSPAYQVVEDVEGNMSMAMNLFLCMALLWGVSLVLTLWGLLWSWLYVELFAWEGAFNNCITFGVIGGIFTGWNIAQYASYAIQTTGHVTIWQHLRAVQYSAPFLLPCNLLGWGLCVLVAVTPLKEWHLIFKILIIAAAPISLGIVSKTYCKLAYVASYDGSLKKSDALSARMEVEARLAGGKLECPFKSISAKLVAIHFAGPFTCFLYTCIYVVVLRLGYLGAAELSSPAKELAQVVVFTVSLLAMLVGGLALNRWITRSNGYFGYSDKMLVAFFIIYNLVSDVQVRLGIVQMSGLTRIVCALVQPLYFSMMRSFNHRQWNIAKAKRGDDAEGTKDDSRLVLACVATMLTQNISAAMCAGAACLLEDLPMFQAGTCEYGLGMQIVMDSFCSWIFDAVTVFFYLRKGKPVLFFFALLDPFLVIAALLVVYMNVLLAFLASAITLPSFE